MIQSAGRFGFLFEPFDHLGAVGSVMVDQNGLQRDGAGNYGIKRFIDGSHGAAS